MLFLTNIVSLNIHTVWFVNDEAAGWAMFWQFLAKSTKSVVCLTLNWPYVRLEIPLIWSFCRRVPGYSLIDGPYINIKVRVSLRDWFPSFQYVTTLASGIDVGQGINVGPGKFVKKNIRRALIIHMFYVVKNHLNNLYVFSNKAVGPGKKPKINKRRTYVYSGG